MNALELIDHLEGLGVTLWEEAGQLKFRAPKGVLTEDHKTNLRASREAVVEALKVAAALPLLEPDTVGRSQPFPLTDVQAAYLSGREEAYDYGGVSCQIYVELKLARVEFSQLQDAWNKVISRHDMLRATIRPEGLQQIAETVPAYGISVQDCGTQDAAGFESCILETRARISEIRFDPGQWPLFDMALSQGAFHDILHFKIDCLIADFMSVQIMLSDLARYLGDAAYSPKPIELSFRDYVLMEQAQRDGSAYRKDRAYWMNRLDTLPAGPDLPVLPEGKTAKAIFDRHSFQLEATDWARFKSVAARHNVTPTAALLSAYSEVIATWSRKRAFCLNLTMLSRQNAHPEVNELVGDFTAVTLLEVARREACGFAEASRQIQQQLWADLDHRSFNGVEVMRELAKARGQGAALMPVVFTSTVGLEESSTSLGEPIFGQSETPQVWIDCQVIERDGGLVLQWDVRRHVLPDGVPEAMFSALSGAIDGLAKDASAWDNGLDVLPVTARMGARNAGTQEASAPREALLQDGVFHQAERTPDACAVISNGTETSYTSLIEAANGYGLQLQAAGVAAGDIVAISVDKGWRQVAAVLAVLRCGGVYLPLDKSMPAQRRDGILQAANTQVVLSDHLEDGPSGDWPAELRILDVTHPMVGKGAPVPVSRLPQDPAYVIYTSGSTGTPKGVVISHRAALNTIDAINRMLDLDAEDRVFGLANLSFDLSVYDIFGPLAVGAALVLPEEDRRSDPGHWLDLLCEHGVTLWNSVPAQMQMLGHVLTNASAQKGFALRAAMLSGDWIPQPLVEWKLAQLPEVTLFSLGGATEASIWSIFHPVKALETGWTSVPYGKPLPHQSFHVLGPEMHPCPDWVTGELFIGGEGLALEYLGDKERTEERFVTHPRTAERLYRTGDLGRYRPGGTIEFLGRDDTQVKIRGHRIELGEIDNALQALPRVAASAVVVDGDDPISRHLVAFVTPEQGGDQAVELCQPQDQMSAEDASCFAGYLERINELARHQFAQSLVQIGGLAAGACWGSAADILAQLGVAPAQQALLRQWLEILVAHELLVEQDGLYAMPDCQHGQRLRAARKKLAAYLDVHRIKDSIAPFVEASAAYIIPLLRGEIAANELFYGSGDTVLPPPDTRDTALNHLLEHAMSQLIAAEASGGARLDVLEVGAGSGETYEALCSTLKGLDLTYHATDVSRYFVNRMNTRFGADTAFQTGVLDINAPMRAQGFEANSYNLLIARNVLHNAVNIPKALTQLTSLLRPGGVLLMVETTGESAWTMASLEFLIGEVCFDDIRAGGDRFFLSDGEWRRLLETATGLEPLTYPATDHPLGNSGQRLFAVRVKSRTAHLNSEQIRQQLGQVLPPYMVPRRIEVMDRMPLTSNGKIDRKSLSKWLETSEEFTSGQGEGPADALEARLIDVWQDVLGVDPIGRNDDFFEIGGDSLLISQVSSKIHTTFPEAKNLLFSQIMRQILHQHTVADLATFLRGTTPLSEAELAEAAPASPLTPLGPIETGPKTILVHDLGGTMSPYLALNNALSPAIRLSGLAVTKVAAYLERAPEALIDVVADEYADILAEAPPAQLVGYGMGGLLAMSVASKLGERRVAVPKLTVIGGCGSTPDVQDALALDFAFARFIGSDPSVCGFAGLEQAVETVLRENGRSGVIPEGTIASLVKDPVLQPKVQALLASSHEQRLKAIAESIATEGDVEYAYNFVVAHASLFHHSIAAYAAFDLPMFAGDMTLIQTSKQVSALPWQDPDVAGFWQDLILGELHIDPVTAAHFDGLKTPYVDEVAKVIIREAQS
ncbi:amino acid adenylation domain-containing protein [Pseudophaeobacter sp.]|uniref:amino acid adenylation domain-containing protein n=1 Tax=Pseudophaeobacter sp. TaxID=1971739 RepID=UPI004059169B